RSMRQALIRASQLKKPISTVVDIGASNGKWTQMAMEAIPAQCFFAIEPLEERKVELELLKQRDARFGYALCVAGAARGEVEMTVTEDLDGSTVGGDRGTVRRVAVQTLDQLIAEQKCPAPYLLKFDTHGYEVSILEGASKTLANTNVIVMETYNYNLTEDTLRFHEMCAYLEELGFRCYDMAEPRLRKYDSTLWQMDLFFAKVDSGLFEYTGYAPAMDKEC
uniref:FkbM family methyltransferase n=1 Tax=Candidatus Electrothrix sp. TaxID=2170559 RepID=UPI0040572416